MTADKIVAYVQHQLALSGDDGLYLDVRAENADTLVTALRDAGYIVTKRGKRGVLLCVSEQKDGGT